MDPETPRRAEPGIVDRRLEEMEAEALTDEIGQKAEIAELGVCCGRALQLEIPGRHAADIEDENLDVVAGEMSPKLRISPQPPLEPQPRLAHLDIEIAVERRRAALGPHQGELGGWRGPRQAQRLRRHLEVSDRVRELAGFAHRLSADPSPPACRRAGPIPTTSHRKRRPPASRGCDPSAARAVAPWRCPRNARASARR